MFLLLSFTMIGEPMKFFLSGFLALVTVAFIGCDRSDKADEATTGLSEIELATVSGAATTKGAGVSSVAKTKPQGIAGSTGSTQTTKAGQPDYVRDHPVPSSAGCNGGLRGLSAEFPWAGGENGVIWNGTGYKDPEELQAISDEKMLARALDMTDEGDDREHALVSIGRRKVPGALEAFELGLSAKERIQVREMALSGLIEHGGAEALELMWRALDEDEAAQIRGQAIWAIALYGPTEAERAVRQGLGDADSQVRGMAILAIWSLKDRPSIALPLLAESAKSADDIIWQEALNVLGRMPYVEAHRILEAEARRTDIDPAKKNSAVFYYRDWLRKFPDLCP